jgi:DNA modification methylase
MTSAPEAPRSRIKELRHVRASELVENPKNWRRHPQFQVDALRGALEKIGYADALIAREVEGQLVLLDGHLRAATTPDSLVPVLLVDLDDQEADFLLATLDPLAALARSDGELLKQLTSSLQIENESIEKMLADTLKAVRSIEAETDRPENPIGKIERRTTLGDLWSLGPHRLLVSDAASASEMARLFDCERAQLVVTDPPYGVDYVTKARDMHRRGFRHGEVSMAELVDGDNFDETELVTLWRDVFTLTTSVSSSAAWYVWHDVAHSAHALYAVLNQLGLLHHQSIVWLKGHPIPGRSDYKWIHEGCFYGWLRGSRPAFRGPHTETTVWQLKHDSRASDEHPTQKPLELYTRPIVNHLLPGEIIFDPFAGSAPAIIAAERTRTRAFCAEIDPARADVALRRWEVETGREAELIERVTHGSQVNERAGSAVEAQA